MSNANQEDYVEIDDEFRAVRNIWISGIVLSTACLILQLLLFKLLPKIRKIDQKILTQLTIARLLNTIVEFLLNYDVSNLSESDFLWAVLTQSEAVTICWMSIYTKILYDKFVLVFTFQEWNFILMSSMVWFLTIPIGVLDSVFIGTNYSFDAYEYYTTSFTWLKLFALLVNMFFFFKIYSVIMDVNQKSKRNITDIVVSSVIAFILFCITSFGAFLHILVTDIVGEARDDMDRAVYDTFLILSSFQGIAITIIFLIRTKNEIKQ